MATYARLAALVLVMFATARAGQVTYSSWVIDVLCGENQGFIPEGKTKGTFVKIAPDGTSGKVQIFGLT